MPNFEVRRLAVVCAVWGLLHATSCLAGKPTMEECLEGSDFISNAALSRDAGMSATRFLGRMEEDFTLIRAFPNDLRWFVHDEDDEAFLLEEARAVYDQPAEPEAHRARFLGDCVDRMLS